MSSRHHSHSSRPRSHHASSQAGSRAGSLLRNVLAHAGLPAPSRTGSRVQTLSSSAPSQAGSRAGSVMRTVLAHAGLPPPSRPGSRAPTVVSAAASQAGSRAPTVVSRQPSRTGPPTLSSYHGTPPPSHHGSQPPHLAFDIPSRYGSMVSGSTRAPSNRAPSERSRAVSLGTSRYVTTIPCFFSPPPSFYLPSNVFVFVFIYFPKKKSPNQIPPKPHRIAHASNSSTAPGPAPGHSPYRTVLVPNITTERKLLAWTRVGWEQAGPITGAGTNMYYVTDPVYGGPIPTGRRRGGRR